jgi:hypothetical protein
MSATSTDPDGVEELYRQLAGHRADRARAGLSGLLGQPDVLFAECAGALEDAAGVLRYAAATYVAPESWAARELEAHAIGLVNVASRFEAAADLARQELG